MAKFAVLTLVCLVGIVLVSSSPTGVVKASLLEKFQLQPLTDVTVVFKAGVNKAYNQIQGRTFEVRGQKMTSLRSALIANAEESQRSARKVLDTKQANYQPFWITNTIIVRAADVKLVNELSQLGEISEIREMIVVPVEPVEVTETQQPRQGQVQWGVRKVMADQIWAKGNYGQGIIVAAVDTGVLGTHRILRSNFIGEYGWFEPTGRSPVPRDLNGHGTHTMGTIAGAEGYGVAPNSTWMACMGCAGSSCSEFDLISCGEFIACPHLPDMSMPDCSKAPHLVSNSWGSSLGGQDWYDDVIRGWNDAEIISLFSAGNSGTSCGSVGSPGDRPGVIGVAATDVNDVLAYFSSVGPAVSGSEHKPEIAAPGVDVLSSYNSNDNSFTTMSGTSMACPHVAGSVALLLVEKPELIGNYQGVRSALFGGAQTQGLTGAGRVCGGIDESTFPNYSFGHGRLDILASSMIGNSTIFF